MILVVVALSTVACGGRRELPKSAVLASLLLSPRLLPRRRVGLSFWCRGEACGGDKGGYGWLIHVCCLERERHRLEERERGKCRPRERRIKVGARGR